MKIYLLIIKLLFLGGLFIVSNGNLHLADSDERQIFYDSYVGWFDSLVSHGFEITSYVIKFEWLPKKDIADRVSRGEEVNFERIGFID